MSQNSRDRNEQVPGYLQEMIDAVKAEAPADEAYAIARRNLMDKLKTTQKENFLMRAMREAANTKPYWKVAVSTAALAIVAIAIFSPFGQDPNEAFATVAERLRQALTVSFTAEWYFDEAEPPTHIEMAFREPDIQRSEMTQNGAHIVQIVDTKHDKGLVLVPEQKGYIELDLANMPSVERDRIQMAKFIGGGLKKLPSQADEVLEERTIDGRKVQGFRVGDDSIWIDLETGDLNSVEKRLGGTRMVMTDFRIDPNDLDDSTFSISPPEDFASLTSGALAVDSSNAAEEDLIEYLRMTSAMIAGSRFPATINPLEIMSLEKEGKLTDAGDASPEELQAAADAFAQVCPRAVGFVTSMRPENDWHYVGKGVVHGDAETPIAWWKPTSSETYRVVWGDLRVTDVKPEELHSVAGNGK